MAATRALLRRALEVVDFRRDERFRYERMVLALRFVRRVALGAALAGMLLPDPAGDAASLAAVVIVVAAPLVRVAWLAIRWYRRDDRRYAAVAGLLLFIVLTGSGLAFVTR